jgi:hypothetical protein
MNKALVILVSIVLIISVAAFRNGSLYEVLPSESILLLLIGFSLIILAVIGNRAFHKKK